mgnify:CR=1 FL=1
MSELLMNVIDFNQEIIKLSKCKSAKSTLKFWTKEPSNNDLRTQLSVLENPDCPESLLRYIYQISLEEGHAFDPLIMWYLQSVSRNPNTPDDLIEDLVSYGKNFGDLDVGQAFVNEVASSHPSFNINNSSKDIESYNRYVLKGALANASTTNDTRKKIEELLKNTEKYPLHWMEISANVETESLEVHANRFYNKIQSEGHLIHEQISCNNEDYEDFDIEELQQCYFEDENFFIDNGVNEHASQTYFFHPQKMALPNVYSTPAFLSISIYIPDDEGTSVNVINVKDVLIDLIRDFHSKDLVSLIAEQGEWLSLYNDINHLIKLLDVDSINPNEEKKEEPIDDKSHGGGKSSEIKAGEESSEGVGKKQVLSQIENFSLGENIAALMYIIADASDGNLDKKEEDFIRTYISKPKVSNEDFRKYIIDLSYNYDEILLDNMKSDEKQIFNAFIDEASLTAVSKWWKNEWYDFFWEDDDRMTFFQSDFISFYKKLFSPMSSTFKKWILILLSELLKADENFTETKQAWSEGLKIDLGLDNIDGDSFTGKQKVTYDSGNTYEGDFINGIKQGKGIFIWTDGDQYEGDWVNGEKYGKGVFTYASGNKYEGDWVDGERDGKGVLTYASGNKYEGDWVDGSKHGRGIFTYKSGNKYEGDWVNDKMMGKGTFTWSDGEQYDGDFNNGKMTGKAVYLYANGNKYEGDWVNGEKEGKGVFIYKSGDKYEGDYISNKTEGIGIYTWTDGDQYEGDWVNGKKEGKGVFTYSSGDKYEGQWVADNLEGTGVFTWADGDKYEGDCKIANEDMNSFSLQFKPNMEHKKLVEIVKQTCVDDKLIKTISLRSDLDEECKKIIDLKLELQERSKNNWCENTGLIENKWSRDVFESLCFDKKDIIRSSIIKNTYIPEDLMMEMIKKDYVTFEEKYNAISNPSCSADLLKYLSEDKTDYLSSLIRKSVALSSRSSKSIVNALLKDKYRWVRESAASNNKISNKEISENITNGDRYALKGYYLNENCSDQSKKLIVELLTDETKYPVENEIYKLGFNCNVYPAEYVAGDVTNEELADCIVDYDGEWSSYIWDNNWHDFDNYRHEYGMSDVARDVQYPDGKIMPINIQPGENIEEDFDIFKQSGFVCSGVSYEKGYGWEDWKHYEAELEYELKPECIKPVYDGGICSGYEYESKNLDGSLEEAYFEDNELYSTTGKGTDFYINIDLEEIKSKIDEAGKDSSDKDETLQWLEDNNELIYNTQAVEQLLNSDEYEKGFKLIKKINQANLNESLSSLIQNTINKKFFKEQNDKEKIESGLKTLKDLFPNLKKLNMSHCYLKKLDVSEFRNLVSINLSYCDSLEEIIGLNNLKKLVNLDLRYTSYLKNLDEDIYKKIENVTGLRNVYGMLVDSKVEEKYWENLDEFFNNEFYQILENNNETIDDYLGSNINIVIEESDFYDGSFESNRYFFKPISDYLNKEQIESLPKVGEDEIAIFLFHNGWDFITSFYKNKTDFDEV